jgi:hypothetical protein
LNFFRKPSNNTFWKIPTEMLGINPIVVEEGHLLHTKKCETSQLLIGCKCYLCL